MKETIFLHSSESPVFPGKRGIFSIMCYPRDRGYCREHIKIMNGVRIIAHNKLNMITPYFIKTELKKLV